MASSYTSNKSLEKPAYNDYAANPTGWSGPVNDDWDAIDTAFGGGLSLNATGSVGTVNLTITQTRNLIITVTGVMTGNAIYTLPQNTSATAIVGGQWIVYNNTSGSFTVTISPISGGGTSVACTQGKRTIIYSDGTNIAIADDRVSIPDPIVPSGTKMLFQQTAAPTGWTKDTTHNNKALRVVSGAAGSGGSTAFTDVFTSRTIDVANLPSHTHGVTDPGHGHLTRISSNASDFINGTGGFALANANNNNYTFTGATPSNTVGEQLAAATTGITIGNTGSGTAMDFAVQYVDLIIATKD